MAARVVRPITLFAGVFAVTAAAGLGAAILFWFDPQRFHFYPICLFHSLTGLLCPGCGSLRALHQLLHGHLLAALRFNALLVISLPVLGWVVGRSILAYGGASPSAKPARASWIWFTVALILVFTLLRNLPFGRALYLAP